MDVTFVIPQSKYLIPIPSMGIPYLSSAIKKHGHTCRLVDGQILSTKSFDKAIKKIKSPIVAVSACIYNMKECFEIVGRLRNIYGQKKSIIAGGPGPSCLPHDFFFEKAKFDYVFLGEGEISLPRFLDYFEKGMRDKISEIPGIVYSSDNGIVSSGKPEIIEKLDELSFPDREIFNENAYLSLQKKFLGLGMLRVSSTRGCPNRCSFCDKSTMGTKLRLRSAENLISEIVEAKKRSGCSWIYLNDDLFTASRNRLVEFCEKILSKNIKIRWKATARVDDVQYPKIVKLMQRAGCDQLFFGIESGSQRMLDLMKKGIRVDEIVNSVALCLESQIKVFGYFIVGYPGETIDDHLKTLILLNECNFSGIDCFIFLPYPGTAMFSKLIAKAKLFDFDNYLTWSENSFEPDRQFFLNYKFELSPVKARNLILDHFSAQKEASNFDASLKNRRYYEISY